MGEPIVETSYGKIHGQVRERLNVFKHNQSGSE